MSAPAPAVSARLAVIDADSGFATVLAKRLDGLGWEHRITGGLLPADSLRSMRLNALVVNLAVVGPGAWDYLEAVCRGFPGLAVIVCTAPSSVAQRVRGLRLGADDWVTKPCHPDELIARIEVAVRRRRRANGSDRPAPIRAGELEIRADQFQAFANGASLELTRREFQLIALLAEASGQVLPREEIYQRVWGYAMAHGDRSVDVFVRKLRQKLDRASPGWRYIHTHFGVGYRFAPESDTPEPVARRHTSERPATASRAAARQAPTAVT